MRTNITEFVSYGDCVGIEVLDRIRRTIGEYNLARQYQLLPAPLGGGLVKAQWFQRYRGNELPLRFDRHRTKLGYGQQSERTERFLGMHNLGNKR